MVTKKSTAEKGAKRGQVTVGKLKLNKETVMDLSLEEQKRIKGGVAQHTANGGVVRTLEAPSPVPIPYPIGTPVND